MERFFDTGKLGKIGMIRIERFGIRGGHPASGKPVPEGMETKPADLDWNRYLGRVRYRDWNPSQYFDFRKFLDFGGGRITDTFVHSIDTAHMFMKQDDPIAAATLGGVYEARDGRNAPDVCNVAIEYRNKWALTYYEAFAGGLSFESGLEILGTRGRLTITRKEYAYYSAEKDEPPEVVKSPRDQTLDHFDNFFACCRSRKLPSGDVYFGHRAAQAAHLATQAYIQQKRLRFDPDLEQILQS
jgi:predicted dehydrogenase